jgi:hypothetical protein
MTATTQPLVREGPTVEPAARPPAGHQAGAPSPWPARAALLVFAALVGVGLYLSSPHPAGERPVFNSPLQNVTYELADRWAETGRPTVRPDRFDDLPPDVAPALTPRDASLRDGEVVPKDHPFPVALFAAVHRIGSSLVPLFTPLAGAACVLVLAALAMALTGSRLATIAALAALVPATSFWLSASTTISSDTVGLLALLSTALLLVRRPLTRRAVVAAGVLAGLVVAARYTNVVLVAALVAGVALGRREDRRALLWLLPGLGALALFVAGYHTWLYGSPLKTGYGIGLELAVRTANPDDAGLLSFRGEALEQHVRTYLLRPEILLLLGLGVAGAVAAVRRRAWEVALPPAAGLVVLFGYYAGRMTWGVERFEANASFLRYLLPVLAFAALAVGVLVARLPGRGRVAVLAVVAVAGVLAVRTNVDASGGIEVRRDAERDNRTVQEDVLDATGPDALVIVNRSDKFLWPQRDTLVATYLVRSTTTQSRGLSSMFDLTPDGARLADVVGRLCAVGEEVHLLNDAGWFDPATAADLDVRLAGSGIERTVRPAGAWELSTFC